MQPRLAITNPNNDKNLFEAMPDVLIQAPDIRHRSSGRRPRAFDTDFGCERTGTRRSRPKTGERYAGTAFNRELLADAGGDETVGSTPGNRRTSFRMRSASSSAIRSRMSRASSTIRKRLQDGRHLEGVRRCRAGGGVLPQIPALHHDLPACMGAGTDPRGAHRRELMLCDAANAGGRSAHTCAGSTTSRCRCERRSDDRTSEALSEHDQIGR